MCRQARRAAEAALIAGIKSGDEKGVRSALRQLPTDWFLDNFPGLLQAAQAAKQWGVMALLRDEMEAAEEADDDAVEAEAELQAAMAAAREQAAAQRAAPAAQRMDAHAHCGESTEMESKRKFAYDPLRKMTANESDAGSN